MTEKNKTNSPTKELLSLKSLSIFTLSLTCISIAIIAVSAATWIANNRHLLPPSQSSHGIDLKWQYLGLSHDIFLIILLIGIVRIFTTANRERAAGEEGLGSLIYNFPKKLIKFAATHPLPSCIWAAYAVAMIAGSSYLYFDMFDWYPDLISGNLLDNFSVRDSFVNETMRRSDYRFFPLGHQDLHILSWLTINFKTWILFAAIQLFSIIYFCTGTIRNLLPDNRHNLASTATVLTITLLFHPATAFSFFHVIYCERTLSFVLTAYIFSYTYHSKNKTVSSFYGTILLALVGIFIKDIAIILFAGPPLVRLFIGIIKEKKFRIDQSSKLLKHSLKKYSLEFILISLIPIFVASYSALALIPSIYADDGLYNNSVDHQFTPDLRLIALFSIVIVRLIAFLLDKVKFNFLDALNISAVIYAISIWGLVRLIANDYLIFPVQVIIALNLGYAWAKLIQPWASKRLTTRQTLAVSLSACILLISVEQWEFRQIGINNTYAMVSWIKKEQISNQNNLEKLDSILSDHKITGDEVNLIINKKSRFSSKSFLGNFKYDRLIEYNPKEKIYAIEDGINKGEEYSPKPGDIVANIDKEKILLDPILKNRKYEVLYKDPISPSKGFFVRLE